MKESKIRKIVTVKYSYKTFVLFFMLIFIYLDIEPKLFDSLKTLTDKLKSLKGNLEQVVKRI